MTVGSFNSIKGNNLIISSDSLSTRPKFVGDKVIEFIVSQNSFIVNYFNNKLLCILIKSEKLANPQVNPVSHLSNDNCGCAYL